ncbi:hypothetical protein ACNOYE_39045 [Nannocystaceae bacterium ST9]
MKPRSLTLPLLSLILIGAPTQAANMAHGRTPVLWPASPCIVDVDRSLDPEFAFEYTIPFEDTDLTVDELDDSRTHQFIGFCRQWPVKLPPPRYVSVGDLERAIEAGWEQPETLADPESTLETSVAWAGCWTRITADDERRPITFAAADEPVVWDTSTIPAGTWSIAGYTWEPPDNLWRRAPWVVRVFDDVDAAAPAVAIGSTPELLWGDMSVDVSVCVAAEPDATVRLDWTVGKSKTLTWTEGDPVAVAGATRLGLPLAAPPEIWGLTLMLRAHVEDGMGAMHESHALEPIAVIEPAGEDESTSDSGEAGTDTGESSSGESDAGEVGEVGETTSDPSESDSGDPAIAEAGATGNACNCSSTPERGNLAGLSLVVLSLLTRRRRTHGPNS